MLAQYPDLARHVIFASDTQGSLATGCPKGQVMTSYFPHLYTMSCETILVCIDTKKVFIKSLVTILQQEIC